MYADLILRLHCRVFIHHPMHMNEWVSGHCFRSNQTKFSYFARILLTWVLNKQIILFRAPLFLFQNIFYKHWQLCSLTVVTHDAHNSHDSAIRRKPDQLSWASCCLPVTFASLLNKFFSWKMKFRLLYWREKSFYDRSKVWNIRNYNLSALIIISSEGLHQLKDICCVFTMKAAPRVAFLFSFSLPFLTMSWWWIELPIFHFLPCFLCLTVLKAWLVHNNKHSLCGSEWGTIGAIIHN